MKTDPKKIAALIIAARPKERMRARKGDDVEEQEEEGEMEEGEEEDEYKEGKLAAAQEILDALKSDDKESLASALQSFIEMCD